MKTFIEEYQGNHHKLATKETEKLLQAIDDAGFYLAYDLKADKAVLVSDNCNLGKNQVMYSTYWKKRMGITGVR